MFTKYHCVQLYHTCLYAYHGNSGINDTRWVRFYSWTVVLNTSILTQSEFPNSRHRQAARLRLLWTQWSYMQTVNITWANCENATVWPHQCDVSNSPFSKEVSPFVAPIVSC